ncbi:MAG: TolC family protein [Nitrosospira sp.]|nr:TolC family protein [Nitrosospira sp.]
MFFLWTVTLQAQTTSLTTPENLVVNEQEAIALFYQHNLSFIAAKFNIDTARAEEIIAGAIPNPVFTFTVSTFSPKIFQAAYRANNPGAPLPAFSPQIEQLIETAGKRRLRMESRAFATEAIKFDLQDTARVLTNTVRRSYYTLLLAQKISQVADNNYEHYREIIRVNEIRLKTGDIAAISFMRIEIESLKAQADQDQARTALNQARADLLLVLGWPENSMKILAAKIQTEISIKWLGTLIDPTIASTLM